MASKQNYILNVIIPTVEREGLTIKTRYGEVTINPSRQIVVNFLAAFSEELSKQEKRPTPDIPF